MWLNVKKSKVMVDPWKALQNDINLNDIFGYGVTKILETSSNALWVFSEHVKFYICRCWKDILGHFKLWVFIV